MQTLLICLIILAMFICIGIINLNSVFNQLRKLNDNHESLSDSITRMENLIRVSLEQIDQIREKL